jgi:hypothetical protein
MDYLSIIELIFIDEQHKEVEMLALLLRKRKLGEKF